ncbi:MAG: hypothetical protein RLZZ458_2049 [Planctomycetota bacterium]|jgi:hypothetical protein
MQRLISLAAALVLCTSLSGCCLMGCGGYPAYGGSNCAPCQTGLGPGYSSAGMYSPAIPTAAVPVPTTTAAIPNMPQQMVSTDQLATY